MHKYLMLFLVFLSATLFDGVYAIEIVKKQYDLKDDPIDCVIVTHPKDKLVLDRCIDGLKKNCQNVRRIIVVSSEKLTDQAEWFDEKNYPFSIKDVALEIGRGDKQRSDFFFSYHSRGPGWYLQQLLKLYAAFVIPGISSNVLVVDADVVFLKPVEFLNSSNGGLFAVSNITPNNLYLDHAKRLVPSYKRIYPEVYSVCHHMLFQRSILEDLFQTIEDHHQKPTWKAFCSCVRFYKKKGASEYETYYNYALTHTDQVRIRELKWINSGSLGLEDKFRREGYDFVAFQSYLIDRNIKVGKEGHG